MLEKIIDSCDFVIRNSQDVSINYGKIKDFAKSIELLKYKHWLESSPFDIMEFDIEYIVNFLLLYHCVGFSYWSDPKWTIKSEYGYLDGSYAMMYCFIKEMKKDISFIDTKRLVNISKYKFAKFLEGNIQIPLFEKRYNNLISVCKIVNEKMNGNFYKYTKNITKDTELFNVIIENFKNFEDIRTYDNQKVYLYKLAQLLVSDILHLRKIKENIEVDYSNIVGCSDYKIPQVLNGLGILKYSGRLLKIIKNREEILENSKYEVEIRASTIIAIDEIVKNIGDRYNHIDINDYIWIQSLDKSKTFIQYHLTRTTSY